MEYRYYITQKVRNEIERADYGPKAIARLNSFLTSDKENCGRNVRTIRDNLIENKPKTRGGIRFFWIVEKREGVVLYVLRRMFRHDSEYDNLQFYTQSQQEKLLQEYALDNEEKKEINEHFHNLISNKETEPVIISKHELSKNEHDFIKNTLSINHNLFESVVFELPQWIKLVKEASGLFMEALVNKLYEFVVESLDDEAGWKTLFVIDKTVDIYKDGENYILCGYRDGTQLPYGEDAPPKEYARGYPAVYLGKPVQWAQMEKNEKSNLWLTDDQLKIVQSEENTKYPLFITGRAGSGKSTMLQFLFAEVMLRYFSNKTDEGGKLLPPIYLSYSYELVKHAKKSLVSLFDEINVYQDTMDSIGISYTNKIKPYLDIPEDEDEAFKPGLMLYTFKSLVKLCVSNTNQEMLNKYFTDARHWNYSKFESEWYKQPHLSRNPDALKNYGPSISWYVIRTYIKGWSSEEYLSCEKYESQELDGRRTVTIDTYKKVYQNVWEGWYKDISTSTEDNPIPKCWDDQDLVRWCLQADSIDELCSAVFCDEAQDFTHVELEFLLSISSLANRRIDDADEVQKFPFVFVGDELQTLNPTGFSWESLRESFFKYLCDQTGKNIKLTRTKELEVNHRSLSPIVQLANRIQLLRATRFKEDSKPQEFHYKGVQDVVCCPPDNRLIWEKFAEKNITVIMPLSDDTEDRQTAVEKEYPNLKGLIDYERVTVYTPQEAKGNEFPHVALYGFGNHDNNFDIDNLLRWYKKPNVAISEKNEADIPLKFIISNAYVGATRATERLYIMEYPDRKSFWGFAFDAYDCEDIEKKRLGHDAELLLELMFQRINTPELWEGKIGHICFDENPDFGDGNTKFFKDIKNLEELELSSKTKYALLQVARYYHNIGDIQGEHRCRARGFVVECNYSNAAKEYIEAKEVDKAVECYWLEIAENQEVTSGVWKVLSSIKGCKVSKNKLVTDIATYVCKEKTSLTTLLKMLDTSDKVIPTGLDNDELHQWSMILNDLIHTLKVKPSDKDHFRQIITYKDELGKRGITLDASFLASKGYDCNAYKEATTLWEESQGDGEKPVEYYKSKVNITVYPDRILYLRGTKSENWYQEIINEFNNGKQGLGLLNYAKYRNAIWPAILYGSDALTELKESSPYMFAYSPTYNYSLSIIKDYLSKLGESSLNVDCIKAIISAQFNLLGNWEVPDTKYDQNNISSFFDSVRFLKELKTEGADYVRRELDNVKDRLRVFCWNHKKHINNNGLGYLIFVELGKLIADSRKSFETKLFYEHAARLMVKEREKRAMSIGRLLYMERHAEIQKEEDQHRSYEDIDKLRKELNYYDDNPQIPLMTAEDWLDIYKTVCLFSSKVKTISEDPSIGNTNTLLPSETLEQAVSNPNESASTESIPADSTEEIDYLNETLPDENPILVKENDIPTEVDAFKFCYAEYNIIYRHSKKELIIRDEDEAIGTFNGINFKDDDDFVMKEGFICYKKDGRPTPFKVKLRNGTITFSIK